MSEFLKGNYQVKKVVRGEVAEARAQSKAKEGSLEALFEQQALEKLGGSIAFVKKSSHFVWKGEKS